MLNDINTVLIIGAGPVVIGQSSEFDYSCSQACLACKEYGKKVIMLNNNPATISTDGKLIDKLYLMAINIDSVEEILKQNQVDGILLSFGGQTALNIALEIEKRDIESRYNVKILGTNPKSIAIAEDRQMFREFAIQNNLPVINSAIIKNTKELIHYVKDKKFPLIIRSAFTLGGLGSGIANNFDELLDLFNFGIRVSPVGQVIIDDSLLGFKEVEYEVIRDGTDSCLSICNMENFDPVGVHTGESIVVAPTQTLDGQTHHRLRDAAFKIIRGLKIIGACNVQFALSKDHKEFFIIEINPRVSRSSALASKATSYPIAKVSAYISLGSNLSEIINPINNKTAAFEPAFDYIVTKIPKWPFDRFNFSNKDNRRKLGTQMKSTGEIMSISKNFESSLIKGLLSLYGSNPLQFGIFKELSQDDLIESLQIIDNLRIYRIFEALRRDVETKYIHQITYITEWFLIKLQKIISLENELINQFNIENIDKYYDFGFTYSIIKFYQKNLEIKDIDSASYNLIDMLAGEFETRSNYYYTSFRKFNELNLTNSSKKRIIILGLGPTDIGNGIEFDYSTTKAIWSLQSVGYEVVVLNNNPGTVSTDYNMADVLCFDPVQKDYLINLLKTIDHSGVLIQCGGQPALNCAFETDKVIKDLKVFGTNIENSLNIENRSKFYNMLDEINIKHPKHIVINQADQDIVDEINFPVITRPSFIIGGSGIEYVRSKDEFTQYLKKLESNQENLLPIVVDEFIHGEEIEVDVVSDGKNIFIPAVLMCVEKAGVHPGDSIVVYNHTQQEKLIKKVEEIINKICIKNNIIGLINFQFILKGEDVWLIEANPRASRSLCLINKITNHDLIDYAMKAISGESLSNIILQKKYHNYYAVKVPVFCFDKIREIPMKLNASMKSVGEVLCYGDSYEEALLKSMLSAKYIFRKDKLTIYTTKGTDITPISFLCHKLYIESEIKYIDYKLQNINEYFIIVDFEEKSGITYNDVNTQMYFCSYEKLEAYFKALWFFRTHDIYSYVKAVSDY